MRQLEVAGVGVGVGVQLLGRRRARRRRGQPKLVAVDRRVKGRQAPRQQLELAEGLAVLGRQLSRVDLLLW